MSDLNSIGGLHCEMMKRCYNEKSVMYNCYGAKGITVCKEWHDRDIFRKWCNENGYVKGLRLQRIKAEENYCPQNCYLGTGSKKKPNGESQYHKNIRKEREQLKKKYGIPDNYCKLRIYRIYSGITLGETGEVGGSGGIVLSILMLAGGIVSIATRNTKGKGGNISLIILFGLASFFGFVLAGSYTDLKIWAGWCLINAILAVVAIVKSKKTE